MATTHIHMGTITRPHGIKGELCVDWYADSPDALRGEFFLHAGPLKQGQVPSRAITGAKVRMHKERPLLTLPTVKDRNEAETLRGMHIYIDRASLPDPSDDEAYLHDILGFTIIHSATQEAIGTLEGVEFPTENQMLWHICATHGQEILLPAVEEFIDAFDEEAEQIFVTPPEGLIELYLEEAEKAAQNEGKQKPQQKHRQQRRRPRKAPSEPQN